MDDKEQSEEQSVIIDTKKLARLVRAKRGEIGLRELARATGISASTLSRVESGKIGDLDTFLRLCRWLGASPESFMREEIAIDPDLEKLLTSEHEHAYVAAAHGSIFARMCVCGKTDVLEIREDILDHSRTYRWKAVEEPSEEK
jgi:transcriptional regulator with XRE-family HTH domain